MARRETIKVPDIGDFESVDVVEVLVAVGDRIKEGQGLLTLESDKASLDVPSPLAGEVLEVLVAQGAKVSAGTPILTLALAEAPGVSPEPAPVTPEPSPQVPPAPAVAGTAPAVPVPAPSGLKPHASPSVRRLAREQGVDLARVQPSGPRGRILPDDVTAALEPATVPGRAGEVESVPLGRIKQLTARNLLRAWQTVPMVTQFDEADVTDLEAFRRSEAAGKDGVKLSPLVFVMLACVRALRRLPQFNASLDPSGERLILKPQINLGIAVDTPKGLVVPVIRAADGKGALALARELGEASERARAGKSRLDEFQGGTFSISSLGGIGGTAFTPIVNPPEVAILGVSRMAWKPVWRDGAFVPRQLLPLSLTYDHRVIDGADGARFTACVVELLGDIRRLLL